MDAPRKTRSMLRQRAPGSHARVAYVELFFDLVFVFCITQLSHGLIAHFTPAGLAETVLLLMAVWWTWIFTSWITNWLDPERTPVRLMLLALMAAGLVMSTSVPKAFEARGLAFALAYAGTQVGRTLFMLWALRNGPEGNRRNFQRILVWFSASAVLWVAGGLAEGNARFALWAIALGIEYAGPALFFVVPGLGRSSTADWDIDGHHMAERCALFIIIALGESILVTGATFAGAEWTAPTLAGFAASFVGSLAMWWIYFDTGADRGTHFIAHSDDPGRVARGAYTYSHLPLVAGIILTAVGDELVLAHPTGHSDAKTIVAVLAGPAVYLAGNLVFKHYLGTRFALSHLVGLALLALIAPFAAPMAPMLLTSLASAVLVLVAAWEMISLRHTRAKLRG